MRPSAALIWLLCAWAYGCVSIPATLTVENKLGSCDADHPAYSCDPEGRLTSRTTPVALGGPDASGFTMVCWNIQKQTGGALEKDFGRVLQRADILLLQETLLSENLKGMLNRSPYHWHLVTAFEMQQAKAGVLTAAAAAPDLVCPLRAIEPLIRIPKTALITRYPLTGAGRFLMVANVHMINFTPDLEAFSDEAERIYEILARHTGPMVVAGDFNTWSRERLTMLENVALRLRLEPVTFEADFSRKVFGFPVDRVYYRGLTPLETRVIRVTSSDHNPLLVRFAINPDG
jgi:endonuclease/exonuclease/phosphatase (EEP) superfamily protein YafD